MTSQLDQLDLVAEVGVLESPHVLMSPPLSQFVRVYIVIDSLRTSERLTIVPQPKREELANENSKRANQESKKRERNKRRAASLKLSASVTFYRRLAQEGIARFAAQKALRRESAPKYVFGALEQRGGARQSE